MGRGGTAKRARPSSPPMEVQYKKIISQDLISLRALRETCDDHNIENKVSDNETILYALFLSFNILILA